MLSISRNVRSCAGVLHATLDTLSDYTSSDDLGVSAGDGPAACAVRYDPLTREQKEKQATWCHACVLDASDGIWTVASTLEGDDWVLMAMKGSLSKQSNLLERMCLYRMQLPKELFSTELSLQLKCQLMPKLRADDLSMEERRAKMMESSERLDKWFANQSKETSFDDTFTPDVAVLRHITDFETGKRSTVCYGPETLQKQTGNFFGQRTKHLLAEVVIPEQYMTFVQSYEVTKEADGRQWRQSSLRIRVLDPNQSYKLRLGMIFYSERDCLPPRMLKGGGQLQGNVAKTHSSCLGPRPSMQLPQNPASTATAGNQNLRPASESLQGPSPSKRIKRIPNTEAVAS